MVEPVEPGSPRRDIVKDYRKIRNSIRTYSPDFRKEEYEEDEEEESDNEEVNGEENDKLVLERQEYEGLEFIPIPKFGSAFNSPYK